jgi:predicted nucleic acid-binding Zn ribbon protein
VALFFNNITPNRSYPTHSRFKRCSRKNIPTTQNEKIMNCLECGEKIIGRSDKKFCNDACRNAYNNKQNKDSTNLMRNMNNKLRKNYRILVEINTDGKTKITRSKLESLGFDFDYFTNLKVYKNGSEYKFIYDYGYKLLEDDFVLIVKNQVTSTTSQKK